MSAQPATSHEDDQVAETSDSPGRRLRLARQARGLKIDQVAGQLHLAPDQISALERDDYEALPGPVFVIGYTRNYARLVGLDPEPLLDAYRATGPETRRPRSRARAAGARQVRSSHLLVQVVSVAIFAAAMALAYTWWKKEYGDSVDRVEARSEEAPAVAGQPVNADPAGPAPVDEAPGPQDRPAADVPAPSATAEAPPPERVEEQREASEPAPAPEEVAEAAPAEAIEAPATNDQESAAAGETQSAASAPGEIVMTFSGPCWVDIRDSERKFKLFGEMVKGDRHVLEGSPPYSVILGNAAAVQITVGGEEFDVASVTRGNVARFTLDPEQLP